MYEAGRAGALELVKGITDFLTGIVSLTKGIGGLNTVLGATLGIITLIKAEKLTKRISNLAVGIVKLGQNIKTAFTGAKQDIEAVTAAKNKMKAASGGVTAAITGIGVAITAVTAIVAVANAIEAARQKKIAEGIAQSKEYISSVKQTKDSIEELVKQYKELYATSGGTFSDEQLVTIRGIQEQINDLLGNQAGKVDLINAKLADQEQIYKNISYQAAKAARQGLSDAANKASESFLSANGTFNEAVGIYTEWRGNAAHSEYDEILNKYFPTVKRGRANNSSYVNAYAGYEDAAGLYQVYQNLISAQKELYESFGENATAISAQDPLYKALGEEISKLREAAEAYNSAMQNMFANDAVITYYEKLKAGFDDSEAKVKQYYRAIERGWGEWKEATDWERKAMMELLKETYPEYFTVVEDGYSEIIDTQSKFNELVKETKASLSELTGAYQTIVGAIEEYNQNGTMSLATLESVLSLSPEYIALLSDENGELELNAEAYADKLRSMVAVLQAQKLDEITAWVNGLTAEQLAVEGLSGAYATLGQAMLDGKLAELGNALTNKVAADILSVEQATQLANAIQSYFTMFNNIDLSTGGNTNTTKDLISEAERQIDWLKFYAEDSAAKQLDIYEDLLEKQTDMDEDRLATIRKIAQLKIRIAEDEADAAIAAKKKEWDTIDREEEYRKKRKDLQDELAYWNVRGTAEAARKRAETIEKIAELDAEQRKEDVHDAELAKIEATRNEQIKDILTKYGELEQDIMENMLTVEERDKVSEGMTALIDMKTTMGNILVALESKPDPSVSVSVEYNAAESEKTGKNTDADLGVAVAKGVKKALEDYYRTR